MRGFEADDDVWMGGKCLRGSAGVELCGVLLGIAHATGGDIQPGQDARGGPIDPLCLEVREVVGSSGASVDEGGDAGAEGVRVGDD